MVRPGLVTEAALHAVRDAVRPGVTTAELDAIAEATIRDLGGEPNFALVPGYRHTICASVDDEVVHGIPGPRTLQAGDLLSIDCGAQVDGFNGDSAFSIVLPDPARPDEVRARERLSEVTRASLWAGIAALATARHLGEVGAAIEDYVRAHESESGYGILEEYVGHGIGRSMHESPTVFNYRTRERGAAVKPGLCVAVEPMVTNGGIETWVHDDDWTVATSDGSMAAHWEHSVAVHRDGIWVLTAGDGGASELAAFGVTPVPIP